MDPSERCWRERGLRSAVLAGDERAWQTWYDESFEGLHAYACWRCAGMRDLADEVVQDTWLTAVRRIRSFDPAQGSFAGWLRGIAANVLRNRLRRTRETQGLNGASLATPSEKNAQERQERAEAIAQALNALPARYEEVLRAKYLEQQSVNDIAAALDETPKAVESLLTRARQAFRQAYLKQENGDGKP